MTANPTGVVRASSLPAPSAHAKHWLLDREVVFLNHGSYGACPIPVLEAQRRYRDMMEREPVRFYMLQQEGLMDRAREAVASLVGCDAGGIAFAPNVTQAVANVIESSGLGEGDEALANDHEYSACLSTFQRYARRTGARLVKAVVPFPSAGEDEVFDAVMARVTDRTRLALISHITSPTAMVFPVARLTAALKERGVEVLIDGAHAPGQVPVDVAAIAPTYYTANLHKWPSCPKGTAFLWVAPGRREGFEPLALSSRAHLERTDRDRFRCLFDYVGTDDYTGFAAVPEALDFMASLEGSWDALMARNHALAAAGRRVLCDALGTEPAVPESMLGSMATVVVPGVGLPSGGTAPGRYEDPLQERLVERHRVQAPVWSLPSAGLRLLRISAQAYNSLEQYEYLARALKEELSAG